MWVLSRKKLSDAPVSTAHAPTGGMSIQTVGLNACARVGERTVAPGVLRKTLLQMDFFGRNRSCRASAGCCRWCGRGGFWAPVGVIRAPWFSGLAGSARGGSQSELQLIVVNPDEEPGAGRNCDGVLDLQARRLTSAARVGQFRAAPERDRSAERHLCYGGYGHIHDQRIGVRGVVEQHP